MKKSNKFKTNIPKLNNSISINAMDMSDNIWTDSAGSFTGLDFAGPQTLTIACSDSFSNQIASATQIVIFDTKTEIGGSLKDHSLMIYFPAETLHRDSCMAMVNLVSDISLFPYISGEANRFNIAGENDSHKQHWSNIKFLEAIEVGTLEKYRCQDSSTDDDSIHFVGEISEDLSNAIIITHEMREAVKPEPIFNKGIDSINCIETIIEDSRLDLCSPKITTLGHSMMSLQDPYKK